jgi:YggT family protein
MPFLITTVSLIIRIYSFLILVRVILSWAAVTPYRSRMDHPIVRLLYQVTDPILEPLRRIIPPIGGTLDISPVVALIILEVIRSVVVGFLLRL